MRYSTFDLVKVLGVHRSSIQQWMNHGFIEPTVEQAAGRGSKSLFSDVDIYRIELFRNLFQVGIPQREAASIAKDTNLDFIEGAALPVHYGVLVYEMSENSEGKKKPVMYMVESLDDRFQDWTKNTVVVSVINFEKIISDVRQKINIFRSDLSLKRSQRGSKSRKRRLKSSMPDPARSQ